MKKLKKSLILQSNLDIIPAMLKTVFISFISLLLFSVAHAETQAISGAVDELSQEVSTIKPPEQPGKSVTAIEIRGNKSISTNVVVSKMKTRIGSPYQENVISDDLKRLYLLGFFSDIKIDTEEYKDGVKVIVNVTERPVIEKIMFTGIKRIQIRDEKIKEKFKSKETQYLDYPSLQEDVRTLRKMYEKIGYTDVTIDPKVDVNPDNNKATVTFVVIEGQRVRIKDILIEGNASFKDSHILRLLKTKKGWLFNAGALKEEVLKEDVERVKAFYRRSGFTDVAVEQEIKPDSAKPYLIYIYIKVQEGKKYLVGNVTLEGNKDISEKELMAKLSEALPGKVFSEEAVGADVSSMQGLYFDRGYISSQVQDTTSLNPSSGRVDIVYNVTEHQVAYVDKVKVRGNIKTKDLVIRREMRIAPGDKFDGQKLKRSKERLQNLGFFEEISYDTEDTNEPNKKDLIVDVKESKTGAFSFGGGYSTVDSLVGFVEVEQKNFDWRNWPYFTGDGQDLRLRASFGTLTNAFDLSFTEPWVFDYPVSFGFDAYRRTQEKEQDVGYGYSEEVIGGDFRLGKTLSEYWKAGLTLRIDEITISDIDDTASEELKREEGKNKINSLTPMVTFDSRDNVFDPHRGNFVTSSFQYAGGYLGGNRDFWKYYGHASHYFPMPWNSVLEVRARVGLAEPFEDTERVPIYERFFSGGAYTIRGYEERSIGPIDPITKDPLGGDAMIVGNLEYTYPLFDFLKVAGFCDVGNVWDKIGNIGAKDDYYEGVAHTGGIKKSFGLGLRIKTPIGPISLDYGIPLDAAPGEDTKKSGRFHFSASHGF